VCTFNQIVYFIYTCITPIFEGDIFLVYVRLPFIMVFHMGPKNKNTCNRLNQKQKIIKNDASENGNKIQLNI